MNSEALSLPPLREIIARYELRATKSLGQNFLLDLNLTGKIARAAGDLSGRSVIEIGPGPGGLTRALLDTQAREVVAVEFDSRAVAALEELRRVYPDRLTIQHDDALRVDCATLGTSPRIVVANLPYNIATPLLIGWLKQIQSFESLTLMFQKEVAERLVAPPGSKIYGRLSVMVGWLAQAKILFDVGPQAFTPPPKVTSSVVRLVPRDTAPEVPFAVMERVVAAAFGQRRKMLRSALRTLTPDAEQLLKAAGINPESRAEELPVAAFVQLARLFMSHDNALQTNMRE